MLPNLLAFTFLLIFSDVPFDVKKAKFAISIKSIQKIEYWLTLEVAVLSTALLFIAEFSIKSFLRIFRQWVFVEKIFPLWNILKRRRSVNRRQRSSRTHLRLWSTCSLSLQDPRWGLLSGANPRRPCEHNRLLDSSKPAGLSSLLVASQAGSSRPFRRWWKCWWSTSGLWSKGEFSSVRSVEFEDPKQFCTAYIYVVDFCFLYVLLNLRPHKISK